MAGSVTIGRPSCRVGTAHGRRYRPRPHPGRGSGASGRRPRGRAAREAGEPQARPVEEDRPVGQVAAGSCVGEEPGPGLGVAVARRDDEPGQLEDAPRFVPRRQPEERLGREDERQDPAARPRRDAPSQACRRCTTGPAGRARRGSTAKPGCRRSASSTIASRCAAGVMARPGLCGGSPAGTNRTRSRPSGLARLLGDREVGDVDRDRTCRRRRRGDRARSARPAIAAGRTRSHGRSQGCGSHSSSVAPIRTRSPAAIPARRSSASMPRRARSRWNRSADSSTSKLVWAAIRSIRVPRTRKTPSPRARRRSRRPSPRSGGRRRRPARVARRARRRPAGGPASWARNGVETLAAVRPRSRRRSRPSALRGRAGSRPGVAAAAGRSSLLNDDEHRLLEQRRVVRPQLLADDVVVPLGIARRAVDDVDEDPRPLDVAQERVAEAGARSSRPR